MALDQPSTRSPSRRERPQERRAGGGTPDVGRAPQLLLERRDARSPPIRAGCQERRSDGPNRQEAGEQAPRPRRAAPRFAEAHGLSPSTIRATTASGRPLGVARVEAQQPSQLGPRRAPIRDESPYAASRPGGSARISSGRPPPVAGRPRPARPAPARHEPRARVSRAVSSAAARATSCSRRARSASARSATRPKHASVRTEAEQQHARRGGPWRPSCLGSRRGFVGRLSAPVPEEDARQDQRQAGNAATSARPTSSAIR